MSRKTIDGRMSPSGGRLVRVQAGENHAEPRSRLMTVNQFAERYFDGDRTAARDVIASGALPVVRPPSGRAKVTGRAKRIWIDERDAEAGIESWKG